MKAHEQQVTGSYKRVGHNYAGLRNRLFKGHHHQPEGVEKQFQLVLARLVELEMILNSGTGRTPDYPHKVAVLRRQIEDLLHRQKELKRSLEHYDSKHPALMRLVECRIQLGQRPSPLTTIDQISQLQGLITELQAADTAARAVLKAFQHHQPTSATTGQQPAETPSPPPSKTKPKGGSKIGSKGPKTASKERVKGSKTAPKARTKIGTKTKRTPPENKKKGGAAEA